MRSRSSAVRLVLAVLALAPSLGVAQYAPKWHVGDWWVTKTWEPSTSGLARGWEWNQTRYDVARIDKVGQQDCYVLETSQGVVWYVRTDNWLVVRQVPFSGPPGNVKPDTENYPLGLVGPTWGGEPCMPSFPLRLMSQDTTFKERRLDDFYADLREVSQIADPTIVKRLMDEGDTAGGRVIRPKGTVYDVRSELAGNPVPGSMHGEREITQSHQLWCDGWPWRLFEERVGYGGAKSARSVSERSWLIAVGHKQK